MAFHAGRQNWKELTMPLNCAVSARIVKLVPQYPMKPFTAWREPTLDEMLADPIIKDLMAADSVNAAMVRQIMSRAANRRRKIPI
jgi:hypothetical protein